MRIVNVDFILNGLNSSSSITPLKLNNSKNVYWYFNIQNLKMLSIILKRGIDSATSSLIQISNLNYVPKKETVNVNKLLNNGVFIPSYSKLSNKKLKN